MTARRATRRLRATPRQALEERRRREKARKNFLAFCTYVDAKFQAARHVRLLAEKLQQVALYIASGGAMGIGRLMILMPPRHGKTRMASQLFPAFVLGLLPDTRIILTSYSADLAVRNSRAVRDTVNSTAYQALFGTLAKGRPAVMVSSDSHSGQAWDLAQPYRGGVVAAGVGGGITGLGAHLLVVDDPFKNREEAESASRRELVDGWYRSSALTRLEENGAVVLFHTRWHPDDLAGRLIRRMAEDPGADQWEIVFLPALALEAYAEDEDRQREMMLDGVFVAREDPLGRAPGEALWPEKFPVEILESRRTNLGSYDWSALYQQMPYLREGGFFRREWFPVVAEGPGKEAVARVRYWDKAASPTGDYTAGVLVSVDKKGVFYIEHVIRGRWNAGERDRVMAEVGKADYERYGPFVIWHQQDPGSAGLDSAQATNAVLAEAGLHARFEPVSGSKEVRAGPLASAAMAGKVRLVKGPWNRVFLEELAAFPNGQYDDQVDAAASAYNKAWSMVRRRRESRIL